MHELSIAQAIADKVVTRAGVRQVEAVAVQIGHFRQVVPDSLQFCWTLVAEAAGLGECRLDIEHVPATVRCHSCDTVTTLDVPVLRCSACGGSEVTLLSGEEFAVVSLEIVVV